MRNFLFTLWLCLPSTLFSQSQTDTISWPQEVRLEPTKEEVLVTIRVLDYHERPVRGLVLWAVQQETKQVFQSATSEDGKARLLLPKNETYQINAEGAENVKTFKTLNQKMARSAYLVHIPQQDFTEDAQGDTLWQRVSPAQTPTRERIKVLFTTIDLEGQPLEDEVVCFTAKNSGKTYAGRTNTLGRVHLMLPEGDTYCLGVAFEKDIQCIEVPKSERAGSLRLTLTTIGTKAFLRRKAERERQLFLRDSLFEAQRIQDSIAMQNRINELDFISQLNSGKTLTEVQKSVEQKAKAERDSLAQDDHYFEKAEKEVEAVLYRMRQEWKNKVIVTDVTCSMNPYMDQVLLWHALQLTQNENNRYLFFNDGDGKLQEEKTLGQTGGIHATDARHMTELLSTMSETKSFGCSGDSPENDLEAMLEGVKNMAGFDELVLIADNLSDVRDIELLTQLEVPVRIILAGSDWGVNEQYLEIAFKTGGSVHTLERDIDHLAELADGESLEIGGHQYRVIRGKFIRVSKM